MQNLNFFIYPFLLGMVIFGSFLSVDTQADLTCNKTCPHYCTPKIVTAINPHFKEIRCEKIGSPGALCSLPCIASCTGGSPNCFITQPYGYGVKCQCPPPNQSNGQTAGEFYTLENSFISGSENGALQNIKNNTEAFSGTFQNIPMTNPAFKSKIAKLKKGKIRIKRKGTYQISAQSHHTSPTAANFNDERAELTHRLLLNGGQVPASISQTVWASVPSKEHRHKHHSHTRFTVYLKEGDDLSFEIGGTTQAGITRPQNGYSASINIQEI